ncbi:restriction endonuclease [Bradyrhizobium sp. URHA0013]|uniref:restriction endonuclease n=1 Tax=Bradyrhizobium sp. URHA0013 TaxID=1380352 RepID=UPI000487D3CB|nr:restriction endonuclease [Bradyrhizobium sp. URHA0013]
MKRLWLVRLGRHGEQEAHALNANELLLGFKTGDLSQATDRDAVFESLKRAFPDSKANALRNFAAQLNQFCNTMKTGDRVIVPFKTKREIAVGEIVGPYVDKSGQPARPVKWLKEGLPRSIFRQDLLYSFGAAMTVCEISRNDALNRVEATLRAGKDPGFEGAALPVRTVSAGESGDTEVEDVDLAEIGRDQIEKYITSHFAGHDLTRLVAEILKAQGYLANVSPPGPDRGIDIVAGRGPLGFDPPRIIVQVKSGTADQPTLQALIGSIQDTQADYGLLVSWSGFTSVVEARKSQLYFRVRLWGRTEIIEALLEVYDRLPEELRAELPLRQVWSLVPEEDQE